MTTCPILSGRRYEEWVLPDPAGQPLERSGPIRDEIEQRVRVLLIQLGVPDGSGGALGDPPWTAERGLPSSIGCAFAEWVSQPLVLGPMNDSAPPVTVVLVHGAWADGSSWSRVIASLHRSGTAVTAAPIPLTSLPDDVAALDRALDRVGRPVVLVGHPYVGAVIGASTTEHVQALVDVGPGARRRRDGRYVFYQRHRTPPRPSGALDNGYIPAHRSVAGGLSAERERDITLCDHLSTTHPRGLHPGTGPDAALESAALVVPACRPGPDDRPCRPDLHAERWVPDAGIRCQSRPVGHPAIRCRRRDQRGRESGVLTRAASVGWPGPDNSSSASGRPVIAIRSASPVPVTSGP